MKQHNRTMDWIDVDIDRREIYKYILFMYKSSRTTSYMRKYKVIRRKQKLKKIITNQIQFSTRLSSIKILI